ncbi:MAG: aminotransferase class I/II-fold pyridoxal phosphate-dependent enzyme [Olsenella sp.]|jgi:aspartate/methionine/tyrosine aminotransferase|nr:aminotransferase class I/II-fold pyridoxal phosphate-dependent enzyme [Olsenella sp.]MCI1645298.1 aminotransferase class I/II-fold pyridoxal phosphate-dependent enzyme [Olsenella sp.]MCI1792569.1 aminotransferase class I/II-fold pyridoxal phosphate-dependent enzyme [Olsenella sp.]MCI1811024.1 aminotransferase class I/II-fold pyridoxal phosphate-dependent enzyme [Olsenella sp.]MCI1879162.1 aminotransferase class I/II-fold pyridoxal phosphate-dependent enzyme [Olsenella sp.]
MPLSLNSALDDLKLSGIRRFSSLAAQTPGCISLTLGEPGEETPANVRVRVGEDLDHGLTHYPPNNGFPWLREAICAWEAKRGVTLSPGNVIVTDGATEALFCAMTTLLNPGDEVIIPAPAFLLYDSLVRLSRGIPVELDTTPSDFQTDPSALLRAITPRTKAIVITSPNNPTGCVLSRQSMDAVAEAARMHSFYVICDDVYGELCYEPDCRRFSALYPELAEQVVVVNSFSKPWAMTGWRLGWVGAGEKVAAAMSKVHQYAVSSVPAFLQHAAVEALGTDTTPMRDSYRKRRDITLGALAGMGLPNVTPGGAFYAFPSIEGLGLSSEEFCERAITEAGVALVPGSCFGGEGHVRLSYATDEKTLVTGLERLAGFVDALRA